MACGALYPARLGVASSYQSNYGNTNDLQLLQQHDSAHGTLRTTYVKR